MDKSNLTTIYWKEDYKNKLKDMIMKEEKTIEYLNNIIKYFEENNIEKYKKFDKRDLEDIKELYLRNNKYIRDFDNVLEIINNGINKGDVK